MALRSVLALAAAQVAIAQNPPTKVCKDALKACKTARNQTACATCEAANADALKAANCSDADVTEFCARDHCQAVLEDCKDALNQTACQACVAADADALRAANCTDNETAAYCSPEMICDRALREACESYRPGRDGNTTACEACLANETKDDLKAAGCTVEQEDAFCLISGRKCAEEMESRCESTRPGTDGNTTECEACLAEPANADALKAANCTDNETTTFCQPPPAARVAGQGPRVDCNDALHPCGDARDQTACEACEAANANATKAANCTDDELKAFCTPEAIQARMCDHTLRRNCESYRPGRDGNTTVCEACLAASNLTDGNCTLSQKDAFCLISGRKCAEEMDSRCESTRPGRDGNTTECEACLAEPANADALKAANCTDNETAAFCQPPPKP